jgi:hypothetical protein
MAVPLTNSGKAGRMVIGTTPFHITKWEAKDDADELDGATAETNGYAVPYQGVQGLTVTLEGYRILTDAVAGLTAPLQIQNGAAGTLLKLYQYKLASDTGPYWSVPNFVVFSYSESTPTRDKITFSCTIKSSGTYTPPVDP